MNVRTLSTPRQNSVPPLNFRIVLRLNARFAFRFQGSVSSTDCIFLQCLHLPLENSEVGGNAYFPAAPLILHTAGTGEQRTNIATPT